MTLVLESVDSPPSETSELSTSSFGMSVSIGKTGSFRVSRRSVPDASPRRSSFGMGGRASRATTTGFEFRPSQR